MWLCWIIGHKFVLKHGGMLYNFEQKEQVDNCLRCGKQAERNKA